jgi:hypothetical protein
VILLWGFLPFCGQALDAAGAAGDVGLGAMGGLLAYLRSVGLDRAVLAQGKLALLPESDCAAGVDSMDGDLDGEESEFMTLDGAALENLEVVALPSVLCPLPFALF